MLPAYEKEKKEYDQVTKHRKGVFVKEEYNLILKALHPDHNASPEAHDATVLFKEHKIQLLAEKELPTEMMPIPTVEEMMEMMKPKKKPGTVH